MKDLKRSLTFKSLFRVFTLTVLMLVATSAKAETVDFGELVPGQEYTLEDFKGYVATWTATESCVVYCDSPSGAHFEPYYDEAHENKVEVDSGNQVGMIWPYSFQATAGTTYYFYISFVWSGGTFVMNTQKDLAISDISYPSNSTFSAAGDAQIDIAFNAAVALDQITISTGSVSQGVTNYRISNTILSISISDILKNWYASGTIVAEQQFKVKVSGLRASADASVLYNGTGDLELVYYAANPPVEMTSAQTSDGAYTLVNSAIASCKFLSYFTSSNGTGKYVFNFTEPLNPSAGTVKLQYGSAESEGNEFYEEVLTPIFSNDNKTMTVDVTGKLRRPSDMVDSGSNYGQMTLGLTHLQGADGQYVYTDTQGGLGSFYYTFPYEEVTADIATDFTPSDSLDDADELEIYVSNYSYLDYDGVKFSWYESGELQEVVVAKSDLSIDIDSFGGAAILVAVPSQVKGKSDVTVSFNNAEVADGLDHSDVLSHVFSASMTILTSVPAAGAELASIQAGSTVGVTVDRTDLGYMQYEIWDLNPDDPDDACVSSRSTLNAVSGQPGVYTATRYGADLKLVKGHTYRFDVLGWVLESDARGAGYNTPAARASFTFSGTTEAFTFSDVKLVSVSPADGSSLASVEDNVVTVTYDNLVSIDSSKSFINLGMGATMSFESIEPVGTAGEYAKSWALTIPQSFLASQTSAITLCVVAYDTNDKLVEGNQGSEENSYLKIEYKVYFNNPDILFTPASGSTVTSLSSILAASTTGIGRSWDSSVGNITVYKGQQFICNITDITDGDEQTQSDGSTLVINMNLNLPEAITEAGTYQVFVPAGFFILGEEFTAYLNKEYMLSYTIEGEETPTPSDFNVTTSPANGSHVSTPATMMVLTFNDYDTASLGGGSAVLTQKGSDEVTLLGDATWGIDLNQMYQPMKDKSGNYVAMANGTYTVTYPAGYFLLGINEDDADPTDSPEFAITYTVGEDEEVTNPTTINFISDPEDGSTVESCSQIYLTFPDFEAVAEQSGYATISKNGGSPIKLGSTEWGVEFNEIIQPLGYEATEEASYVVTFPAGYFLLAKTGESDVNSPMFTVSFTVGTESTGLTYTVSPDPSEGALEELKSFTLTFSEPVNSFNYSQLSYVGVSYDNQITYFSQTRGDDYSYSGNSVTFTFAEPFTETGSYLINIPAGTIFFGDWGDIENEEIYIRYGVEKSNNVTFNFVSDPENGATVESCSQIYLLFPDYDAVGEASGRATISKDGGAAQELCSTSYEGIEEWNALLQPLKDDAGNLLSAEDGTYVVTFPAGYFDLDFDQSPEFTVTFTVSSTNGVNSIAVDGEVARYFDLNGIEIKNPGKGVYIKVENGKASKVGM